MFKYLSLFTMICALLGCVGMNEEWQPSDGKLTPSKQKMFAQHRKECFLKIEDAKVAGIEDGVARLAYYHCMQNKGWTLVE
ncbi:MAG: hypothetical protein HRU19_17750 [Pseudobacteriovorax sp.]|nr:hypothetical protein [Pseudobacteriovorax sp.]